MNILHYCWLRNKPQIKALDEIFQVKFAKGKAIILKKMACFLNNNTPLKFFWFSRNPPQLPKSQKYPPSTICFSI